MAVGENRLDCAISGSSIPRLCTFAVQLQFFFYLSVLVGCLIAITNVICNHFFGKIYAFCKFWLPICLMSLLEFVILQLFLFVFIDGVFVFDCYSTE